MKRIYETNAGKSISAYVILNKKGQHVATVRAHFGNSVVMVETANTGLSKSYEDGRLQQGRAGGSGYDKFAAALAGHTIDGHVISDHCGMTAKTPKAGGWPRDFKEPKGWHLANYNKETGLYRSLIKSAGLRYLQERGYQVIQAI